MQLERHIHRAAAGAAALALAFTMAGCSNSDDASDDASATAETTAAEENAPEESPEAVQPIVETSTQAADSEASATPSAVPSPSLSDAFVGYGLGVPEGTTEASVPGTWYAGEYVAQNPTGDIQIIMLDDEVRIYAENWAATKPYGNAPGTANINNGIVIAGGTSPDGVTSYGEWPLGQPTEEGGDYRDGQVIQYGQSIEHGNYVCGANDKGVTCWSKVTGRGAFVTPNGFTAF